MGKELTLEELVERRPSPTLAKHPGSRNTFSCGRCDAMI